MAEASRLSSMHCAVAALVLMLLPLCCCQTQAGSGAGCAGKTDAPDHHEATRSAALNYCVIDLGTLPGDTTSHATYVNNLGDVVGSSGADHAFLYHEGRMTPIQPPADDVSLAIFAINDRGTAVGSAGSAQGGGTTPTVYHDGAAAHLPGIAEGVAYAINDTGRIAGTASGLGPFLFVEGKAVSLGAEGGNAYAVNNADEVVGMADDRAFLWSLGTATELGALPGDGYSWASDINDRGDVVGSSGASGVTDGQAFLYTPSAGMTALGKLQAADAYSIAFSINACGHVVGVSGSNPDLYATSGLRAFLFADGRMLDLNDLIPASTGVVLTAATSINDRDQIAGRGVVDDHLHAVLLRPANNRDSCTAPGRRAPEQERSAATSRRHSAQESRRRIMVENIRSDVVVPTAVEALANADLGKNIPDPLSDL